MAHANSKGGVDLSFEDNGALRVFSCPMCGMDAPHTVTAERKDVFAVVCSNCRNGSLVTGEVLRQQQVDWEEELKEILHHLDQPSE